MHFVDFKEVMFGYLIDARRHVAMEL